MPDIRDYISLHRARHSRHNITSRVRRSNQLLGQGCFGDVHLGTMREGHSQGGRQVTVAIKTLRGTPAEFSKLEIRLMREMLVWSTVGHQNVASFFGIAYVNGPLPSLISHYLCDSVMNYVYIYPGEKRRLVAEITRGLNHLHYKYVIHGDLKPDNVRVSESGTAKIIDFGISKIRDVTGFTTNLQRNPRYTPPELLPIDPNVNEVRPTFKTDIFSYAMLILQTLQGPERHPYSSLSDDNSAPYNHIQYHSYDHRLLSSIHRGDRPRPRGYPRISARQWSMIETCWSPIPTNRPKIDRILSRLPEWL